MRFKIIFFLFLLLTIAYAAEVLEVTKEGITNDFSKGEILELNVVESSSLKIGNPREDSLEIHKFRAVDIGDNFLNLSIDKKNSLKIEVAEIRRIDIDNDGTFDASVNLVNIRSKVATLLFKSLDEKVPSLIKEESILNKTEEILINETKIEEKEVVVEKELNLNLEQTNYNLFIILGVIFILLLSLILYFIFRKSR